MNDKKTIRPFGDQNGYTTFSNYILDYIMPNLSPNGWKVLCFIIRKTEGWNKDSDQLSFSQIMDGTGIKNRTTVSNAIDELKRNHYVNIIRGDRVISNTYSLNTDFEIDLGSTEIGLPKKACSTEIGPEPSTEIVPEVVQKSDSQNKGLNKDSKENYIDGEPSPLEPDTKYSRLLFKKLGEEFRAKRRSPPKRFPSMACKRKFEARAIYLNGSTEKAIDRALQKGILSIVGIVDFIAKWDKNNESPTTHSGKQKAPRQKKTRGNRQSAADKPTGISLG